MVAGDIPNARLMLQQAAVADNATAALELGATYDPIELEKLDLGDRANFNPTLPYGASPDVDSGGQGPPAPSSAPAQGVPNIEMARTWYQKAKDLGSIEAVGRLERLVGSEWTALRAYLRVTRDGPIPSEPLAIRAHLLAWLPKEGRKRTKARRGNAHRSAPTDGRRIPGVH